MTTVKWAMLVTASLRPALPDKAAGHTVAQGFAGARLLSVVVDHDADHLTVMWSSDADDPLPELIEARPRLERLLEDEGAGLAAWEALECVSQVEADRRLVAHRGVPELLNTGQFAELLGVSEQRVRALDTERRAAAAEGREHAFPAPLVPGWWVRAGAERYAANRRGPGRPRRDA